MDPRAKWEKRTASPEVSEDIDVWAAWQWRKGLIMPHKDGSVICPKSPRTDTRLNTSFLRKASGAIDRRPLGEYRGVSFGVER